MGEVRLSAENPPACRIARLIGGRHGKLANAEKNAPAFGKAARSDAFVVTRSLVVLVFHLVVEVKRLAIIEVDFVVAFFVFEHFHYDVGGIDGLHMGIDFQWNHPNGNGFFSTVDIGPLAVFVKFQFCAVVELYQERVSTLAFIFLNFYCFDIGKVGF